VQEEQMSRLAILACLIAGCAPAIDDPPGAGDQSPAEDDWSLPAWVQPAPTGGLFEEQRFDPRIRARGSDLAWAQLMPTPTTFSDTVGLDAIPEAYAGDHRPFSPLVDQLAGTDPYWMRLFLTDTRLAPAWLPSACPGVRPIARPGYLGDDDLHYPIWDDCVWRHAREAYRYLLVTRGVGADPRLQFIYVPGAFTYSEFDFDLIEASGVSFATFDAWFQRAIGELVAMMGEHAHKLVYTGEDYPFSGFGPDDDLLARDAVAAGMGVRTGITELFNFHLSDVPAYGTRVDATGHMVTDETWQAFAPGRVRGAENECFDDCGFSTDQRYYAVKMANLKALQLRMNWILPGAELLRPELQAHWDYVAKVAGHTRATSPDAWVALRRAEDRSLADTAVPRWPDFPYVHNWERWIVQRDVEPDGVSRDGREVHEAVLAEENGRAIEGRAVDPGDHLYFDVDDGFLHARTTAVDLKVTYRDDGLDRIEVEYATARGPAVATVATKTDSGAWRTATVRLPDASFDDTLPAGNDLRLSSPHEELEVRFVRIVKVDP